MLQTHARLVEQLAALAMVAVLAGGDEVVPGVGAATVARDHMVEGQVMRLGAAVLAGVLVADEDLASRQAHARAGTLDPVVEANDRRCVEDRGCGADLGVVVLDYFGL